MWVLVWAVFGLSVECVIVPLCCVGVSVSCFLSVACVIVPLCCVGVSVGCLLSVC